MNDKNPPEIPVQPVPPHTCEAQPGTGTEQQALAQSDLGIVRIVEDLVDLLIERDLIRFTDLPEHAQKKLLERKSLRTALQQRLDLLDNDEDINLI